MSANVSHTENPMIVKRIDQLSSVALIAIVGIAFALSFSNLRLLAEEMGVSHPALFAILVDIGILVFKGNALRTALYGKKDAFAWTLVFILTGTSVYLNIAHIPEHIENVWLARLMYSLPVFILLTAFIAVSGRIEQSAKHGTAVTTYDKLTKAIADKRVELDKLVADTMAQPI